MKAWRLRLFLILVFVSTAAAQIVDPDNQLSCVVSVPVAPELDHSSVSALVGALRIDCNSGTPVPAGLLLPQLEFDLFLNVSVLGTTQPMLAVDAPGTPSNPNVLVCPSLSGCLGVSTGGLDQYDGLPGHPNLFQGFSFANAVFFSGVPFEPPGPSGHITFELENISVDPSVLPPGFPVDVLFDS